MSCDPDIDLEDIEAHLYGQVYHSSQIDEVDTNCLDMFRRWRGSPYNLNRSGQKSAGRYFENTNNFYEQRGSKAGSLLFNNLNSPRNDRNVNIRVLPHRNNDRNNLHNFSIPQFLVSPVNNIVVFPSSTNIIADQSKAQKKKQRKQRQRSPFQNKVKKEAKKIRLLCNNLDEGEKNMLLRSYLSRKVHEQYLDKLKQLLVLQGVVQTFDGILIGKSGDSVMKPTVSKINKNDVSSTVILSSDDEGGQKDSSDKNEDNKKFSGKFDVNEKCKIKEEKNCPTENVSVKNYDDDDVIFIEPKPLEVIEIDVENASTSTNNSIVEQVADDNRSALDGSNNTQKEHNVITSKERNELLSTPDSNTSNDFLENSSFLDPSKFNFELHGSDFSSKHFTKSKSHTSTTEVFESESSCSDASVPIKIGSVFNEIEFESPVKDIFLESNLESFGDYIMPKRNLTEKTKSKSNSDGSNDANKATLATKGVSQACVANSSDSSSESDYEDDNLINVNSSKNSSILPQLTPIQAQDVDNDKTKSEDSNIDKVDCTSKKVESRKQKFECLDENKESNDCNTQLPKKRMRKRSKKKDVKVVEESFQETVDEQIDDNISELPSNLDEPYDFADAEIYVIDSSENDDSKNVDVQVHEDFHNDGNETELKKGFAAFWTTDKEKFYKQSWGQENISVDGMQKTMSDDPNLWKIVDADRQLNSKSRGVRCRRCRQYGHKAYKCKNKPVLPKCSLCGVLGHAEPRCPNKMCTQCGKYGNYYTTYCSRCAKYRHYKCKTCQMQGHIEERCPDLWRRYYLTTEEGPIIQPDCPEIKPKNELCCSGCASFGHLEYECKNYYNRAHPPVNPKIHSYNDAYPKLQEQTGRNNVPSNDNDEQKETSSRKSPKLLQSTSNKKSPEKNDYGNKIMPQNHRNDNVNTSLTYVKPTQLCGNVFSSNNLQQNVQVSPWQVQQTLPAYADMPSFAAANIIMENNFNNVPQFIPLQPLQQNLYTQSNNYNFPIENIHSVSVRDLKRSYFILKEICNKLDLLVKHRNDNPNLILPDIKKLQNEMNCATDLQQKLQIRTNIDNLYEKLNIILFGVYGFKDGERYVEILKDHFILLLQCRPHNVNKNILYPAYQYIFSRSPKHEDYDHLVKLTNHSFPKLSLQSLNEPVHILIKNKYENFMKMSEVYPFASTNYQKIHYLFERLIRTPSIIFNFLDIREFCANYNNFVINIKQNF